MGVSTNVCTYYGIEIPYNQEFADAYDKVYENCPVDVLIDGMGGDYIVLGKKLFDSGDFRWGMEDGDAFKEIDTNDFGRIERDYKLAFILCFPQFNELMIPKFKILAFTHYH